MGEATAELMPSPTFVAPHGLSSQFISVLARASSKPSPSASVAEFPASAMPDISSHAHEPLVNDDAGDTIIGIACMLLVLCTAAVVTRILARRFMKLRLEADDYLALIGLVRSVPSFQGIKTH